VGMIFKRICNNCINDVAEAEKMQRTWSRRLGLANSIILYSVLYV